MFHNDWSCFLEGVMSASGSSPLSVRAPRLDWTHQLQKITIVDGVKILEG